MAKWNTNETPDNPMLSDGIYSLRLEEIVESGGTEDSMWPLAIEAVFTVEAPVSSKGAYVRRRFWLGSKEDPKAESPNTRRSRDWTAYKNYLKASDVSPTGDTEEEAVLLKDTGVLGKVGVRRYATREDKAYNLENAGKPDFQAKRSGMTNTVYGFYKLGTKEVGYEGRMEASKGNGFDTTASTGASFATANRRPSFLADDSE